MQSFSSPSSVSADSSFDPKSYDVFISFRGEDTRRGFTSHLRDALIRNQIRTYIDDALNKGDEISPSLLKAIEDSHISIIDFSEHYASSKWCLDELLKILECRKQGQDVIPVFYEVDPSNVRKLKQSYKEAFAKHERDSSNNQDKLSKWKQALLEAANIAGWDSRTHEDESKLLHKIVKDVLEKLVYKYPRKEIKCPFGSNENLGPVESLLREFQIIGIWGMGGTGKTTIAKWFFNKYSPQYEGSCFLANIRENFGSDGQALHIELISRLLGGYEKITSVESNAVRRRLSSKRVLIVLDDVSASKQLEYLVGEHQCFGSGSRIIITTRDKHVLVSKGVQKIHNVKGLNIQESLQLFSLNAFNQNHPAMGYEELSHRIVDYAKGTPLALKVLGSFLHSKTRNEWECALEKLRRIPNDEIHSVLKWSYDGLNHEEREIFLDITCFLKGLRREHVLSLLNSFGFYADIGLRTLQDKALITIENDIVQMHDLLQEMGWQIVCQESIKEPGERSRLWDPKDVYEVLKNNKGTNKIEGILLDMSYIRDLQLNDNTLRKMCNLRFVKFYSSDFRYSSLHLPTTTNLELYFDKLRYLQWDGFLSKELPLMFCPENLVELLMPNSNLEKLWDGVQDLVNLKRIDLRRSRRLKELPDFSMSSNLEEVDLTYCISLHHVHPSLLSLHSLVHLDLYGCEKLKSLESECHLRSLKYLGLLYCTSLEKFSMSTEEIRELNLQGTSIKMLPRSIGRLSRLESLKLKGLKVENLPNELSCLRNLKELVISDGSMLMIHTEDLQMIFHGIQSLENLSLMNCSNLFELPDNIGVLSSLCSLNLSGSNIERVPESIKQLTNLKYIWLNHCKRLGSLPDLEQLVNLRHLDLGDCTRLQSMPKLPKSITSVYVSGNNIECWPASFKPFRKLRRLSLFDCKSIECLPELPESITALCLTGSNIECLPPSIRHLTELTHLDLCDSKRLQSLPELPQSIIYLNINGSNVECLPANINQLKSLKVILLRDCERIQTLQKLPQSIRYLDVRNCTSLETVTSTLWKLKRKLMVDLRNCVKLDEHLVSSLLEDTYSSIKESENREICIRLPGSRAPEWFKDNRTTRDCITIELDRPGKIKAFAFCSVLSPFFSNMGEYAFSVLCSQDIDGPMLLDLAEPFYWNNLKGSVVMNYDHIHLWCSCPFHYFSKLKPTCKVSFRFSVRSSENWKPCPDVRIKECAVCPIYGE